MTTRQPVRGSRVWAIGMAVAVLIFGALFGAKLWGATGAPLSREQALVLAIGVVLLLGVVLFLLSNALAGFTLMVDGRGISMYSFRGKTVVEWNDIAAIEWKEVVVVVETKSLRKHSIPLNNITDRTAVRAWLQEAAPQAVWRGSTSAA
jgi:hypothetical protein